MNYLDKKIRLFRSEFIGWDYTFDNDIENNTNKNDFFFNLGDIVDLSFSF